MVALCAEAPQGDASTWRGPMRWVAGDLLTWGGPLPHEGCVERAEEAVDGEAGWVNEADGRVRDERAGVRLRWVAIEVEGLGEPALELADIEGHEGFLAPEAAVPHTKEFPVVGEEFLEAGTEVVMLGCKAWAVAGSLRASNREIPLDALHEAVGVGMGRVGGWLAGGWRHDAARAGRGVVSPHGQGRG